MHVHILRPLACLSLLIMFRRRLRYLVMVYITIDDLMLDHLSGHLQASLTLRPVSPGPTLTRG